MAGRGQALRGAAGCLIGAGRAGERWLQLAGERKGRSARGRSEESLCLFPSQILAHPAGRGITGSGFWGRSQSSPFSAPLYGYSSPHANDSRLFSFHQVRC